MAGLYYLASLSLRRDNQKNIQPLVERAPELADLMANVIGIIVGITLGWSLQAVAHRMTSSRVPRGHPTHQR